MTYQRIKKVQHSVVFMNSAHQDTDRQLAVLVPVLSVYLISALYHSIIMITTIFFPPMSTPRLPLKYRVQVENYRDLAYDEIVSKSILINTDLQSWLLIGLQHSHHWIRSHAKNACWHIEAETRWPPFSRRHFRTHFLERKCYNFG